MAQLGERRGIKHGMKGTALARRGMLEGTINPVKGESMTDQETPESAHVTADDIEAANDLIDFIEACPSMFHTAATIMAELDEAGFTYLPENAAWDIEPGGRYYTQRNTSSVVAFKVGEDLAATWGEDGVAGDYHFQLTASHSDSPTFKVKAVPELDGAGETLRLNTEAYGGMIDYTWFDRPLALAGRVLVREGDRIESRLLATEREVAIIPSLAIHMNRGVNEGFAPNRAVDLCPLISAGDLKQGDFDALIADELDVEPEQILGRDLFLVNRQDARIWGWADEFISTPKLDDLACAYTSLQAFLGAENAHDVSVFCCFDNEEVGSETKQGAMSTFLADALRRINGSLGFDDESYHRALAASMLVSCDNAHAVHPNHAEKCDARNQVVLNGGIVIKEAANQHYCTDAFSRAVFQAICDDTDVPTQAFANKSDMATPEQVERLRNYVEDQGLLFYEISAATTKGTKELMYGVWERLSVLPPVKQFEAQPLTQEELDDKLISKKDFRVTVEDGVYFVEADWLLDILRTANMDDYSSLQYFQNVLRTSGIIDKLEEMGIEEGDTVSIFDFEFEYLR